VAEKKTVTKGERTKPEGLTLKELQAQVGGVLPDRIEMRRRRRGGSACNSLLLGCVSLNLDLL
jgi:hypothetical protein